MMSNLKDEILGEMIKADNNGTIHSSNYGMLAETILSKIEKRIDSKHVTIGIELKIPDNIRGAETTRIYVEGVAKGIQLAKDMLKC